MLSPVERKVLKRIAEMQLVSRNDLKRYMQSNGGGENAVDTVTQNLVKKSLLTEVRPIGSTCYVITQKGNQMLEELMA
jgi:predicted transcriptional regulator